jgi:tetratricopeptide (TPR) repeat protein
LTFVYPKWGVDVGAVWQWIFPVLVVFALAVLFVMRKRIGRGPVVGAAIFVGTLAPALGFVNVYPMRYTFVADHYQYHAAVGLIALVVAGAATVARKRRGAGAWAGGVVVLVLFGLTVRRAGVYADKATLWGDTVRKDPGSWIGWLNLADAALAAEPRDVARARDAAGRALSINPRVADTHFQMARALAEAGDYAGAVAEAGRTVEIEPRHAAAYNVAGAALRKLDRPAEAVGWLEKAVALDPRGWRAQYNLGRALRDSGRAGEAVAHLEVAAEVRPDADTFYLLADCYRAGNDLGRAEGALRRVVEMRPGDAEAHLDLAKVLVAQGRQAEAAPLVARALELRPELRQRSR